MSRVPGPPNPRPAPLARARRDLVVGAVLVAAVALLLASGLRLLDGVPGGPASRTAVLLDLALILFGWRRYRDVVAAEAERAAAEARVASLARVDELTGLLARRGFADDGAALLRAAARRGSGTALLVVDLDQFRAVNALHGHLAGDLVLAEAAGRVRRALPPGALAGRLDGDTFAVLLAHDPRHPGTVDALAGHLVGALAQPIVARGLALRVGASVGVAAGDGEQTMEVLLRRATAAVRAAKAAGRNRHAWYDAASEHAAEQRGALEAELRAGITAGEFLPAYAARADLRTGALRGFAVVMRWQHPTRGLLSVDQFGAIAEGCGLIGDLWASAMRRAFAEARDWDPSLTLSTAVTCAQMRDPWLAQKIVKLLVETGFPATRLEIAVGEEALHGNLPLGQSILVSLANQGVRLALDGLGTGASGLHYLSALPFDRIGIDGGFVATMAEDAGAAAMVSAIARLGESLHLSVTAAGVEDAAARRQLAALGCTTGEAGDALPVAAARRLLAERGLLPAARAADTGVPEQRRSA